MTITALRSAEPATPGAAPSTGVFLSPQSLTFPVAASVCTMLVALVQGLVPGAPSPLLALSVCAGVGALILWQGWPRGDARTRGLHLAVGLVNILVLTATVLGVTVVTGPGSVAA